MENFEKDTTPIFKKSKMSKDTTEPKAGASSSFSSDHDEDSSDMHTIIYDTDVCGLKRTRNDLSFLESFPNKGSSTWCILHDKNAQLPRHSSLHAAGLDLYSPTEVRLNPMELKVIDTGVTIGIPDGCYGRIAPKSGLTILHKLTTLSGVVDSDYEGQIKVCLFNLGSECINLDKGTKIAQIIFEKYVRASISIVQDKSMVLRGGKGFGECS
jgi:dUTP pyrophosphatase